MSNIRSDVAEGKYKQENQHWQSLRIIVIKPAFLFN